VKHLLPGDGSLLAPYCQAELSVDSATAGSSWNTLLIFPTSRPGHTTTQSKPPPPDYKYMQEMSTITLCTSDVQQLPGMLDVYIE